MWDRIDRPRESVYGYSTSELRDAEESLQLTSGTKGRERKLCSLHPSMRTVPENLESAYTVGFMARSKSNMVLICFPIFVCYFSVIPAVKDVSRIQDEPPVRRSCVCCLRIMEDIPQQRCMRAWAMHDIVQEAHEGKIC